MNRPGELVVLLGQLGHRIEIPPIREILNHLRKCGIRLGRGKLLITIIPRHRQIMRGALGISQLRIRASHEEIEESQFVVPRGCTTEPLSPFRARP